jgi:hypothetical protein
MHTGIQKTRTEHRTHFRHRATALSLAYRDPPSRPLHGPLPGHQSRHPRASLESIHIHDGDISEDEVACLAQSTGHIAVLGAITLLVPSLKSLAHNTNTPSHAARTRKLRRHPVTLSN